MENNKEDMHLDKTQSYVGLTGAITSIKYWDGFPTFIITVTEGEHKDKYFKLYTSESNKFGLNSLLLVFDLASWVDKKITMNPGIDMSSLCMYTNLPFTFDWLMNHKYNRSYGCNIRKLGTDSKQKKPPVKSSNFKDVLIDF